MAEYFMAVDDNEKKWFDSPDNYSIKYPGICHPENPFSGMVVMENATGSYYDIRGDTVYEVPDDYENVTVEIWNKYKNMFNKYYDEVEAKQMESTPTNLYELACKITGTSLEKIVEEAESREKKTEKES